MFITKIDGKSQFAAERKMDYSKKSKSVRVTLASTFNVFTFLVLWPQLFSAQTLFLAMHMGLSNARS